jgi:hypothetical protein
MSKPASPSLAHLVLFTLKERTPERCDALVAACRTYLTDHPGVVYFSAGVRAEAYARPVNDRDFDVALVLVFATEADHDRYQKSPRHQQFVAEQSAHWAQVRVFDALC